MNKFLKVMDDIIIAILGKSIVEKRVENRRKKTPRKRKYEKRKAGVRSTRRKK